MEKYFLHFSYYDDGLDGPIENDWVFNTVEEALKQINATLKEWNNARFNTPVTLKCFTLIKGKNIPLAVKSQIDVMYIDPTV